MDRDKIKGLLIERSIVETKEMIKRNPRYVPKQKVIKKETKKEENGNKENKSNTDEPKRNAGRPSKKDKG